MTTGTVLIVEDDKAIGELVACVLIEEGYQVLRADDPTSLQRALTNGPSLLLLDLTMPHLNAAKISRQLRSDPATAHIGIVIMSARAQQAAPHDLIADAWLPKPFDLDQLCRVVSQHIHTAPTARPNRPAS